MIEKDNNERNSTLFDKTRETYNAVCNDETSFDERLWSTKPRKIPTIKDQEMLNEVTKRLISTMNVNSVDLQPEQKLWELNCITFSVAVAWKDVNSEIKGDPSITQRKDKELTVIETKIVQTRQLQSKTSAETEAMQKQTKMTKRQVKRRKQISVECKSLSVKDLTEFIDKLKLID